MTDAERNPLKGRTGSICLPIPIICYTFPLESEVLRIVPIERIYKAPKYILVLVVTKYKQGCRVYSFKVVWTY